MAWLVCGSGVFGLVTQARQGGNNFTNFRSFLPICGFKCKGALGEGKGVFVGDLEDDLCPLVCLNLDFYEKVISHLSRGRDQDGG